MEFLDKPSGKAERVGNLKTLPIAIYISLPLMIHFQI